VKDSIDKFDKQLNEVDFERIMHIIDKLYFTLDNLAKSTQVQNSKELQAKINMSKSRILYFKRL
jgi:hypothetical protein